jgi:arylesterase/paraoxonase
MKIVGGGSVGYCNDQDGCKIAADKIFAYPNGIVLGDNGLVYVASSITGEIFVMEHTVNNTLIKVMTIPTGYPLDNLSKDANGEIYAAAFPKILQFVKSSKDPFGVFPASTVLKITSLGDTYKPEKVLEGSGTVPGTTVAVHDVQTGRFFLGGKYFVCR